MHSLGNPVALQQIKPVQNESYGVLGGGVPQSIELKDNNAYTAVKDIQTEQSIETNSNVAYERTVNNHDPSYEDAIHYYY